MSASTDTAATASTHGTDAGELGDLIHVALSRVVGEARGYRGFTRNLCVAVAGIARLDFRHADGTTEAAYAPGLPAYGWSDARTVLQAEKLTPRDVDRAWAEAIALDGVHARLPLKLVEKLFPPSLWPVFIQIINWGPAETSERLERFCRLEALREIEPTRARPEGGLVSAGTIDTVIIAMRRFLLTLAELRAREHPSEFLQSWLVIPPFTSAAELGAAAAETDRSAPPLITVRRALRELNAEVVRRASTAKGREGMKGVLLYRAVLAVLATTGARVGAVAAARVRDYDRRHVFPDGSIGPALRLYPGKTMSPETARWKALPPQVACWIDEHLAYNALSDLPNAALWPSKTDRMRPMHPTSISKRLRGASSTTRPTAPLLPKETELQGEPSDPVDVSVGTGYSAHTLRHLAEQLAYEAGHAYLVDNPDTRAFITPQVLVDALLDRSMSTDRLGYKDLKTKEGIERWARVASLGVWEWLYGDRGARKAPDPDRIAHAADRLAEVDAQIASVEQAIRELRERRRELEKRGIDTVDPPTLDDLVRLLFQLSAIAGSTDEEHEELEHLQRIRFAAETELRVARTEVIPISDDAPVPAQDEAEIAEESADDVAPIPVRDWLTVAEAARAFSVSEPTMRRRFRGNPASCRRGPSQSLGPRTDAGCS